MTLRIKELEKLYQYIANINKQELTYDQIVLTTTQKLSGLNIKLNSNIIG